MAPIRIIEQRIHLIRRQKVMLDSDLAEWCDVPTYRLAEAVKRNQERFPPDFMFRLTLERKYAAHDEETQVIFRAIEKLLEPPPAASARRIGFRASY